MKKRVAEIMYIVESERKAFLEGALNLDDETAKTLWMCGVRNQQYFALNDLIFMTFEYRGSHFERDMEIMAEFLDKKGNLVKKRRKDVPIAERATTNWWAPVKKLGDVLTSKPFDAEEEQDYLTYFDGDMALKSEYNDIAFDEDDWTESIPI